VKRAVLYATSFLADVVGWLIVLSCWALWGQRLQWKHGVLTMEFKQDSWPARSWYKDWGGTTFGHAIIYNYSYLDDEPIWMHELVHVEQFESECIQNFVWFLVTVALSVRGFPTLWHYGLLWLMFGPLTDIGASYVTAWLRGKDPYTGSVLEEGARGDRDL
jgi:hypothetical protein